MHIDITGGYTAPVSRYYEFYVQIQINLTDPATFFFTVNEVITTGNSGIIMT